MVKSFIKDIFIFNKPKKSPLTRDERLDLLSWYGAAFLIPFIFIIAGAIARKIAPFGENTLMAIDAWGQYFPMLREMKRAFRSLDFSYSFTGALGFDLTAQSAYYTNSPLWFILFLLPGELTPGQVDLMVFIRFGLCGLTFFHYLSSHYGKKEFGMVFFSAAYALSGYTLAFINQFMWMDAVILLPLVMLGIEQIIKGEKGMWLYFISLFLTIFANFYIAFMVCFFAVLWYMLQTVCMFRGVRNMFISAFRFGICSLLAGIINLPVLVPLLRAIGNTLASDLGFGNTFRFYHSMKEMLMMLLPFRTSSLAFEAPNIYFGAVCAVFCLIAVLSKEKLIKKLLYLFLFVFMFVSFNFNLLDFIWHGFHFPNQLPGRQSFIFAFLGLVIAYCGYKCLTEFFRSEKNVRTVVSVALCTLICAEVGANAVHKICNDTKCVGVGSVLRNDAELSVVRESYNPDPDKNEFWRIELSDHRYNGGQLYGYNGISHYSSTMSGDCYNFFLKLGMSVYARNVSSEYAPNPVLNSLFGIRYIVSSASLTDDICKNVGTAGKFYIQENEAVLPLFYVAEKDALGIDMSLSGHAFTNEIFKCISGSDDVIWGNGIFDRDSVEGYSLYAKEFLEGIENIRRSECTITDFGKKEIKGTVNAVKDGVLVISLPAKDVKIEIDGTEAETLTIAGYMAGAEISEGAHEITIKLP